MTKVDRWYLTSEKLYWDEEKEIFMCPLCNKGELTYYCDGPVDDIKYYRVGRCDKCDF